MLFVDDFIRWAADFCIAGALLGCLYTGAAAVLTLRFGRGPDGGSAAPHPVTVLVPLCGDEPGLETRLRALCAQSYAAPVQILCASRDADDPGLSAALRSTALK